MKKIIILLAAVALTVAFTIPASAADEIKWNWYGDARVRTFWVSEDFKDSGTTVGGNDSTEDSELEWQFQGNSRIGFRVKGGAVGGRVELRTSDDNASGASSTVDANFARLWGSWNFGAGTLYVGKRQPPVFQFVSGQIYDDTGLIGWGAAYSRRRGQLALGFGGFEVALVQPREDTLGTDGDADPVIPKIEARWGMGFDTWNFNVMGGYQYAEINNVTNDDGNNKDLEIDSYIVAADVTFNFGPFYTKGYVNYGQNLGPADWVGPSPSFNGSNSINDVTRTAGGLILGFKLTDMVTFEGGAGGYMDEYDASDRGDASGYSAYIQAVLQMHPGVFFIPEFSYFDEADLGQGNDEGPTKWALGGKWQINF